MEIQILFVLACVLGFFMAWGVGANDVANAMGTSVGSKALTYTQAILVAAIFEMTGALLAGGEVTNTIRGEIIDSNLLSDPFLLVYGMLAALLASGIWLWIATFKGWPVSTTHSIVGAIIGFGVIAIGPHVVYWEKVLTIASSWVFTPIIAGFVAYALFTSVQFFILNTDEPLHNAKRFVPFYIFIAAFVISMVTLTAGLKHISAFHFSFIHSLIPSLIIGIILSLIGRFALRKIESRAGIDPKFDYVNVEKTFGVLMIFTASCMAFAHGSNDVANAIGPLAAAVSILKGGELETTSMVPFWILFLGAAGIVVGLSTYGYKVIRTIGSRITELTPTRGFAAELATASTVVIASGTGLPVSTTHTLVGAVLGVGFARGIGALDLKVISGIFLSWLITIPAGAILAVLFFYLFKVIFSF